MEMDLCINQSFEKHKGWYFITNMINRMTTLIKVIKYIDPRFNAFIIIFKKKLKYLGEMNEILLLKFILDLGTRIKYTNPDQI